MDLPKIRRVAGGVSVRFLECATEVRHFWTLGFVLESWEMLISPCFLVDLDLLGYIRDERLSNMLMLDCFAFLQR